MGRVRREDRWREVFWFLKKWNHNNSRWTANGTGVGGEDRWREVFWFLKKWNHYNSRWTANGTGVGGGRIGGGRGSGSLKSGTIIIQGGQLTARGWAGEDRWREVFWFLKKWNHYNSRRTANCRGWGGSIGGGRCSGSLKSGTIIIQGGQLTAGGGGGG